MLTVSFGHGIFALIIYFMANKNYGIFFTIGALISGVLHFLYESYKILYDEEILIDKLIERKRLKIKLINTGRFEFK